MALLDFVSSITADTLGDIEDIEGRAAKDRILIDGKDNFIWVLMRFITGMSPLISLGP